MAMNDNTNLDQSLREDPIQIIAKSKSSTSINAKAIKVIKPDLVPPSNEINKNPEKENETCQNNSDLDETWQMESYNAQKEDDRCMGCIRDPDILDMIKTIVESRKKYPLPDFYSNCIGATSGGNRTIMFDDIGPITDERSFTMLIPPGIGKCVGFPEVHSNGSNHYVFAEFGGHVTALSFINKFNNLEIPGTDFTYKLSWAPVKCRCNAVQQDELVDLLKASKMKTLECDGEEHVDESKGNQFDGPRENSENDKQVDAPQALEIKTEDYYAKVDKIATGLEKLFSALDDEAHSATDASPFWTPCKAPKYYGGWDDDGVTQTLFLSMVDPVIKVEQIMRLFGKYGECSVDLPPGGGCATVTFKNRSSVISAYKALSTVLYECGICIILWGIEIKYKNSKISEPRPDGHLPCYVFGDSCPKRAFIPNEEFSEDE